MKLADKHYWKLVISGADRRELADAFRDSQWKDSWWDHAAPIEDNDTDAGMGCNLDIPDMDTLIAALKCVGHLKPTYGINLYCDADFGTFKANASLAATWSGFAASACMIHRTGNSLDLQSVQKLNDAEKALGELRNLLAVKGGA